MDRMNKLGHPAPQRIMVLRALQLGDMLCSVPALRALRAAAPEAVITLVGLPWARNFVDRFNYYLDDFIEFPGFPGFPERRPEIDQIPRFLDEIQWLNFDLAIQMQGSGSISNSLIQLMGARHTAGFYLPGQYCPDPERYVEYPVHEPEVWRHLRLMDYLGVPLQGADLEFPLYSQDWEDFRAVEARHGLAQGNYVLLHPGSRAQARRWPLERFALVGDALAQRGLQVVLTGTQEEAELTAEVSARMTQPCLDLAGQTSLGALGSLVSCARLLVCNDTGISHIAAALRTPSVVLFSASDPNRWAPLDHKRHRPVTWASSVQPDRVMDEVDGLLAKERSYAL